MTRKGLAGIFVGVGLLLTAGCAGKIRYPHYYMLEITPPPKPATSDAHLPATVAVRRFEAAAYLRQGRIVYREGPAEIGFYEYHRWAADPATTATEAMIESLRSSRSFSFVTPYNGQDKPDYVMSGRLERLDEIDYGGAVRVEAKISAELVNARTGATVWADDAADRLSIDTRDVKTVVVELGHAVHRVIDRLATSLAEQSLTSTDNR